MRHDPVFQGYLYLCIKHNRGIVPFGILSSSRDVKRAMKSMAGCEQEKVEQMVAAVTEELERGDDLKRVVSLNMGGLACKEDIFFYEDTEKRYIEGGFVEHEFVPNGVLVPGNGR